MLCADFQETIASPDLRGDVIGRSNFEELKRRIEVHKIEDDFNGRVGLSPWFVLGRVQEGVNEIEKKRLRVLKKFSQAP